MLCDLLADSIAPLPDLVKIVLTAILTTGIVHILTSWRDRRNAARLKRAGYLHDAFKALTDFSLFLQFDKLRSDLDLDAIRMSANSVINEMELLGTAGALKKLHLFREVEASEHGSQQRIFRLEELREEIRDQFRSELGFERNRTKIRLDFWNFPKSK